MAKKTRKKKLLAQTLNEFRAWLSGVEEMQEDEWVPNNTQWELIRQRIALIEDANPELSTSVNAAVHRNSATPQSETVIPHFPNHNNSAFDNANIVGPSTPRAPPNDQLLVDHSGKTPDIDSSEGYSSSFA